MLEKIISLFEKSGKDKIMFQPSIRLKMTPHSPTMWIDRMFKLKDQYMITVSSVDDSMNKNLKDLDDSYLTSLSIRLYGLMTNKTSSNHTQKLK